MASFSWSAERDMDAGADKSTKLLDATALLNQSDNTLNALYTSASNNLALFIFVGAIVYKLWRRKK